MIQHGFAPYLECSSHGDKRLSAFFARLKGRGNRTIEEIYQGSKILVIGGREVTGLSIKEAKGKRALNGDEIRALYAVLWDEYMAENPHLLPVITAASGLADKFGQRGSVCQATELWRIRCHALGLDPKAADAVRPADPLIAPGKTASAKTAPTQPVTPAKPSGTRPAPSSMFDF